MTTETAEPQEDKPMTDAERIVLLEEEITESTKTIAKLRAKLRQFFLDEGEEIKPDAKDLAEFARRVFANQVYKKIYKFEGGNITVASLTDVQSSLMDKVSRGIPLKLAEDPEEDKRLKENPVLLNAELAAARYKVMMLFQVRQIGEKAYPYPEEVVDYDSFEKEWEARFGATPSVVIGMLTRLMQHHLDLQTLLAMGMFDENFHKGAGLVQQQGLQPTVIVGDSELQEGIKTAPVDRFRHP